MVRNFTQDLTPPELESFYLDMDASTLTFYFSETVNSLSFDPEIVVIQDAQLANRSYQLTGGNIVTENDSVLVLNITKADLDMIKFDSELATSSFTTYITFNSSLVVDMNSNAIVNISNGYGLRVANYTPDTTPPYLISYNLDLDSGEIELTFSETVNASSFRINEIVLQNNYINVTEPFNYYALESGGPVEITLCHNHCHDHINYGHCHYHCHSDIIRLNVSISDLNQLKARYMLARSRNDTFLVHTQELIYDMNGNSVVPIVNGIDPLQVTNYTEDTTSPQLVTWDIDLNVGLLILTYDETVNRSSLVFTAFTIQEDFVPTNTSHVLTGGHTDNTTMVLIGTTITGDNTVIVVNFTIDDLNEIKRKEICTDMLRREDCYLSFTNFSISDMNGNSVEEKARDDAEQVTIYTPDITSPRLVTLTLFDLTNEVITLEFDETVNISSFNTSAITLKNFYDSLISVTLTGPDTLLTIRDNTTVSFMPTVYDLNRIKQIEELCTMVPGNPPNCYIEFPAHLVLDMAMNPVVPIDTVNPARITAFAMTVIPDSVSPQLVNFSIDLELGNITLTFDETVNIMTIDQTAITFHDSDSPENATEQYTLTVRTPALNTENWLYVHFMLAPVDLVGLKYMENLATNLSTTYVSIVPRLIEDMNTNQAEAILMSEALQAWRYERDNTSPTLLRWSLNLNDDYLFLTFDEPVRISTTNLTAITLNWTIPDTIPPIPQIPLLTLTGGLTEYEPGTVNKSSLRIQLNLEDVRSIKLRRKEARDFGLNPDDIETYLSVANATVLDMADHPLVGIPLHESLQVQELTLDGDNPYLLYFDIDLDKGTLSLFYEDVVDQDSLTPAELTLHNQTSPIGSNRYVLTGGTTNTSDGYFTVLDFSYNDLNTIKRNEGLATNENNTFITFSLRFISDDRGLGIIQQLNPAVKVRNYTEDTNQPSLLGYTLDMNNGTLHLTLDVHDYFSSLQCQSCWIKC